MHTATLFSYDGGQAVRLPDGFHFEGSEVFVHRVGRDVVLRPCSARDAPQGRAAPDAQALLDALAGFEPGTALQRDQPTEAERAPIRPET
jgi:antitoxin VapB